MMFHLNAATMCFVLATSFVLLPFHASSLIHGAGGIFNPKWKASTRIIQQQQHLIARANANSNDDNMNAAENDFAATASINNKRRAFLKTAFSTLLLTSTTPLPSHARYILNDEGEYEDIQDVDWQTAWKGRLDKAQNMSTQDIFMAARGAGNTELRDIPENESSKKRRALSGCREASLRKKAGVDSEKECTKRVLGGEVGFMLDVM